MTPQASRKRVQHPLTSCATDYHRCCYCNFFTWSAWHSVAGLPDPAYRYCMLYSFQWQSVVALYNHYCESMHGEEFSYYLVLSPSFGLKCRKNGWFLQHCLFVSFTITPLSGGRTLLGASMLCLIRLLDWHFPGSKRESNGRQ